MTATHSHAHDHGHHHHDHGDENLESLFTVGICGAFGTVAVALAVPALSAADPTNPSILTIILSPDFHLFVLIAGIALLLLTLVRAVVLWREAGAHSHEHHEHVHDENCDHGHDNGPAHVHDENCGHDHKHEPGKAHSHGHDHEHSHGGVYWRAVVLLFPIVLFVWGQPNKGFSDEWINERLGNQGELGARKAVASKEGGRKFSFDELNAFANNAEKRESEEGKMATVKGQFKKIGDKEATLFRLKMTCCAADTIPLKARIVSDSSLGSIPNNGWVEVTGQLQFLQVPGSSEFLPVIVAETKNIKTKGVVPE